jgi:uncharacterized SAM-binding protein YcdF (DUF218 family)
VKDSTPNQTHQRSTSVRRAVLIIFLVVVVGGVVAARGLGRWLVVQDPLDQSGAIVVLSGGMPYRAVEAAKLYRAGTASEVWLTRPWHPPAIDQLGVDFQSEEIYSREVLTHEGVPASAVKILGPIISNTEDEIRAVCDEMRRAGVSRVIIVTSPPHTRRVRTLWRELSPNGLYAIVRAASGDPYDANHWWGNTRDALDVTREVLGLLNAWAGLPVKPPSRPAT